MKKFNKKITAFVLVLAMLLAFVPSLSFADEPAAPMMILKMDSDYYKKGDAINAELWVYNANFNTAGFAIEFDVQSAKPSDSENFFKTVVFEEYNSGKGIFEAVKADLDSENGLIRTVLYVSPNANDAPAVESPTNKNAREVQVGSDGYKLADIKFTAQKDGKASFAFTTVKDDVDFNDRVYVLGYKGETPHDVMVSVEYAETPNADAELFAQSVEKIGEVTIEDEALITAAYAEYEALSDLAKAIAAVSKTTLDEAKEKLDAIKAEVDEAANLEKAIAAMTQIAEDDEITLEDAEAVKAAKALYDALSDESKAQISEELVKALDDAVAKIKELEKDSFKLGDVNGDGTVNALDATQILRYANGKSSVLTGVAEDSALYKAADVNGDGTVNALDATQILRYANGKSSVLSE